MLKVTNLETTYNDIILALKYIYLEVPQGRIVALLGADGAGKTTTINTFYAGVAGSLMAYYQKWIVPGNFDISLSVAYIAMIVLGGVGTILGSILGAILITGIPHGIVYLTDAFRGSYPNLSNLIVDLKLGIFGLIIVLTLLFEPQGLVGIYRRIKVYWKTWPFKY